MKYANIILDIQISKIDKAFTYKIPSELEDKVRIGSKVDISFGKGDKVKSGYVVDIVDKTNLSDDKLKDIISTSDNKLKLEQEIIDTALFIKDRYGSSFINALKCVTPVKDISKRGERINPFDTFTKRNEDENISLTEEQIRIVDDISNTFNFHNTFLIKGVTGSGKTFVYIELAKRALEKGLGVIVLIPEIALTYQTIERFQKYFGDSIAIMHSSLTAAQRYTQYQNALSGKAKIVIGPRSALFMPVQNIGLYIIDEENDPSYKSEKSPRYNAIEVARFLAKRNNAPLVLGSATPSMDSYYKAKKGDIKLFELNKRVGTSKLPDIEIVDLSEEVGFEHISVLSKRLEEKIEEKLQKNEQALLFLNRRGYSGYVSCLECGHVIKCDHCDVSMTYHKNNQLVCHYCGRTKPIPKTCPECNSKHIGRFKIGTEKLEELLCEKFPDARILRIDKDTTSARNTLDKYLSDFYNHKYDILIGTQMIVKGHHFPNVTLVCALCADMSLNIDDFRSNKTTYDLMVQVAGRAGRKDKEGEVLIQTYNPEHFVFKAVKDGDFDKFYNTEIINRKLASYPPACNMLMLCLNGKDESKIDIAMKHICERLLELKEKYDFEILGPTTPYISKVKDIFRRVVYIKSQNCDILIYLRKYIERYMEINKGYNNFYLVSDLL